MTIRSVWHSTLYSAAVTIVIKNVINPSFLVGSTILVIFLWLNGSFFFHISFSEIKSRYLSDYRRIWEWWHHRIVNKIINNLIMESHGLSFFTTECESEMILQKSDLGYKKTMIKIILAPFVPHGIKWRCCPNTHMYMTTWMLVKSVIRLSFKWPIMLSPSMISKRLLKKLSKKFSTH